MKKQIMFAVLLCAGFAQAATWTWQGTSGGSWLVAANWQAPEGAEGVYPNGADADVVFPYFGNNVSVTLGNADVTVRSMTFENNPAYTAQNWRSTRTAPTFGSGTLRIGEGGIRNAGTGWSWAVPIFNCNVVLTASQDWLFTPDYTDPKPHDTQIDLRFQGGLSCSEDVMLQILCPGGISCRGNNFDSTAFYGTLKCGTRLYFQRRADRKVFGNARTVISVNSPDWGPGDGYGSSSVLSSRTGLVCDSLNSTASNVESESIPFNFLFDWSSTAATNSTPWLSFGHPKDNAGADYHTLGYTQRVGRALSGHFANVLWFCGCGVGTTRYGGDTDTASAVYFPDRQHTVFSADNSGLVCDSPNGYINIANMVAVLKNDNVLGMSNAIPVKLVFQNTYSAFTGILAGDGVTVRSPISRGSGNDYYMLFGAADPDSTCTFTGTIAGTINNPVRLTAPKGAKARFEGVISGISGAAPDKTLEIFGAGDVELAAANTFSAEPNIRFGRLLLANSQAANNKTIHLGGFIPREDLHVKVWNKKNSFDNMTAAPDAKFNAGAGYYTAKTGGDFYIQGVKIEEGDLVLQNGLPEFAAKEGVYRAFYDPSGTLVLTNQLDLSTQYGLRVDVDDGTWAGEYIHFTRKGNIARQHIHEDARNPDVAVMISEDGVTHSGRINVTNNYSSGTSTIGMTADGTGAFTGLIALSREVTFTVEKADAVLEIANNIIDTTDTPNGIAFGGVGTVDFAQTIDFSGRVLSFAQLTDDVLEAGGQTRYILATGSFANLDRATIRRPENSGWLFRTLADKIIAVKRVGTFVEIR